MEPLFNSLVAEIQTAYERLDHQLGWRFLYSPERTFARDARLVTVGLNPGGRKYEPPQPSVEAGNAYRYPVESWPGGRGRGPNPLQQQMSLLYGELARSLSDELPDRLMDDTLAGNFCPFRSPSWDSLPRRVESVAFSRQLWRRILEFVAPSAVICLGDLATKEFGSMLVSTGARIVDGPEVGAVGWGRATYQLASYESSGVRTLLVRLPHLSRYAIFGRAAPSRA